MNELNNVLGIFWGSRIESFDIDMMNHKIQVLAKRCENDVENVFHFTLEGIGAFCWINDWGKKKHRLDIVKWEFIELESASILENIEINVSGDETLIDYVSKPNIALELWNSVFLVEAKKIIVDGISYDLNLLK